MPLGLGFIADRWSEAELIGFAYVYEQVSRRKQALTPYVKPKSGLDLIIRGRRQELRSLPRYTI